MTIEELLKALQESIDTFPVEKKLEERAWIKVLVIGDHVAAYVGPEKES